jgi:hypothetical protein
MLHFRILRNYLKDKNKLMYWVTSCGSDLQILKIVVIMRTNLLISYLFSLVISYLYAESLPIFFTLRFELILLLMLKIDEFLADLF